jgi:hypothetical protein
VVSIPKALMFLSSLIAQTYSTASNIGKEKGDEGEEWRDRGGGGRRKNRRKWGREKERGKKKE